MKPQILLCASIAAFALLSTQPGLTQGVPPPSNDALPPNEIVAMVRSSGLEPVGRPIRQGPAYALRAVDPTGEEVRVVVDAHKGRIVKVVLLSEPRYAMPLMRPPFGPPPRPMAIVPDGGFEDVTPIGPGTGPLPAGPPRSAARDPAAQAGPPPLPRPRPKLALDNGHSTGPVAANPITPPTGPYDYE